MPSPPPSKRLAHLPERPSFLRRMTLCVVLIFMALSACLHPAPDLGPTREIRSEDTRLVVLLREVDRVSETDPQGASRTLRDSILPRARANADRASELSPAHPRAARLTRSLAALLNERASLLAAYADALQRDDTAALLANVRAQRQLESRLTALDTRIEEAAAQPATRGCTRPEA